MKPFCLNPLLLITGFILLLTIECTRHHDMVGATTETTNGVTGTIMNDNGEPVPNTIVKIFPDDYDPMENGALDESFVDTTDADGEFDFNGIIPGTYALLGRHEEESTGFLLRDIVIVEDSFTNIHSARLNRFGSITADFSKGISGINGGYVYIPGTDIFSMVENDGSVLLNHVPPVMIKTIILTGDNREKRNILRNALTVEPDDTVAIVNPLWKFIRRIVLNTSSTGAGVTGDVYHFPVLIRLNDSNFDFTEARKDGGDIVFSDIDSIVLPHEIERWDAASQHAEIWVKVDTIRGDNSTQSILMYWGNPSAMPQTAIGGIFDTADGYQGVWHLEESVDDSVRDATVNRYHGMSPDSSQPPGGEGMIGNCRVFDGTSHFITMPNTADGKLNFQESGYYTVSAWVLLDTFDRASHCIVSKGYEQYYIRSTYISREESLSRTPFWEFVEFGKKEKWQPSTSPATAGQWVLLTGVRKGDRQFLYCNGTIVDSTVDDWWNDVSRSTTNDLTIGRFAEPVTVPIHDEGYCYFKGSIDEVRISSRAHGPDRIRLCFLNQRSDDRLVEFK